MDLKIDIADHIKLAHHMANKYRYSAKQMNVDYDDMVQEALIAIWKCAENFDSEKQSKFSTYACAAAANEIKKLIRKASAGSYKVSNPIGEQQGFIDHLPSNRSCADFKEVELRLTIEQIANKSGFQPVKMKLIDCLLNGDYKNRKELYGLVGCATSYAHASLKDLGMRLKVVILNRYKRDLEVAK